jgi:histidinol-phosphate aminotransferase
MALTYTDIVRKSVLSQPVYEGGKPIEDVAREFGLDPASIVKLASNENPIGSSPLGLAAAKQSLEHANLYPDGGTFAIRTALAKHWNLKSSQFIVGNGSNETLILLAQAFAGPGDEIVFGAQGFIVYKLAALMFGATPVSVPMPGYAHDLKAIRAAVTDKTRIVFLACPNNPTGTTDSPDELIAFAKSLPDHVILCLDEAYAEYLDTPADFRPLIAEGRKIVCARTFSKIFGLAGLRVGYLYGSEEVIGLLNRVRQPFNVNLPAQAAAVAALIDDAFVNKSREVNAAGMKQLYAGFEKLGLGYIPSFGNFIVFHVPGLAPKVNAELMKHGVIVRPLAPYGMPDSLRVTVGTKEQNERFLAELKSVLGK